MGWLEVDLGNFRTAPLCVRVPFSDRDLLHCTPLAAGAGGVLGWYGFLLVAFALLHSKLGRMAG
jgi:hypothetical protein